MWAAVSKTICKLGFAVDIIVILVTFPVLSYYFYFNCFPAMDLSENLWVCALVYYVIKAYIKVFLWGFNDSLTVAIYKFYVYKTCCAFFKVLKDFIDSKWWARDFRSFLVPVVEEYDKYIDELWEVLTTWDNPNRFRKPRPQPGRWYFLKPYPSLSHLLYRRTNYIEAFLYSFVKTFIVSVSVGLLIFLYLVYFFQLQLLKQLAIWFIVLNLFFWLISGFNFFLKRYKYGKFTSAIQRFWKRTNMCFWLIEGFLFSLFFYYFLNSSQEPLYMYDSASLNQDYLLPLPGAYLNLLLLAISIFLLNYLMLSLAALTLPQLVYSLVLLSVVIFFSFFVESYQFYYVLGTFADHSWVFSEEEGAWELEGDSVRLRTKQYYFLMCLIAKYWHFIFIFLSWVFFILKVLETKRITYNLLAFNTQNIIILYVLNLLCYVQWLKWVARRFLDVPYEWFFTDPDTTYHTIFLAEVINVAKALVSYDYWNINVGLTNFKSLTIYLPDYLFLAYNN